MLLRGIITNKSIMGNIINDMLPVKGGNNCQMSVRRLLPSKLSVRETLDGKLLQVSLTGKSLVRTVVISKFLVRGTIIAILQFKDVITTNFQLWDS